MPIPTFAVFACRDFGPSSEADGFVQDQKRQMSPTPETDGQDRGQGTDAGTGSVALCVFASVLLSVISEVKLVIDNFSSNISAQMWYKILLDW